MRDDTTARIVFSTVGDEAGAVRIARAIVERRLAACVNVVPGVRSIYRWRDELHDDAEVLLVIKTVPARVEALRAAIVELHEYDVPEVVEIAIDGGHRPYLEWLADQTR